MQPIRQTSSTLPLPGVERRGARRRRVRGWFAQFRLAHADLLDASPRGMAIELHQGLPLGARYSFRLRDRRSTVRVQAVVRWCRLVATLPVGPGELLPVYRAGLSFTTMRPDQASSLEPRLDGPPFAAAKAERSSVRAADGRATAE